MLLLRETPTNIETDLPCQIVVSQQFALDQSKRRISKTFSSSGISANAPVHTARGIVAAKDLRQGDQVHTRDNGLQAIDWLGQSRLNTQTETPIRMLEKDGSRSSFLMAPNQLILHQAPMAELLFGEAQVLCPAHGLLGSGRFEIADANPTMVHILFEHFQLIRVGDFCVESLVPDMPRIQDVAPDAAAEIIKALPRLAYERGKANYVLPHLVLDNREVSCLFS